MKDNLQLLYGNGTKKRITAVEYVRGKENTAHVFTRDSEDNVTAEYHTYEPFIYVNENDKVFDEMYDGTTYHKLMGSNHYNVMIPHKNYGFIKWIKSNSDDYQMPFLQSQWMVHSGETQFKGMSFSDPLRLYCDIEVVTAEGFEFPNSTRDEDKIIIISMRTNRGDEWALVLNEDEQTERISEKIIRCKDEKTLLEKWVRMIRKIDPDIICGHNFFGFDFPYIRDRAMMLGVPLQIGRDGSEPNSFPTSIKFAEKSDEYENFQVYGRHILDTYFMAKQFDIFSRSLNSYGLKACVKHLDKASDDRVYIEGNEIANVWRGQHPNWTRTQLIEYAFDDVRETEVLDKEWGGAIFEMAKLIPLPCQDVSRYGTGNLIDLLFIRHYYNYMWSLPKPDERRDYGGGYADTFFYGFFDKDSVYADVSALYPSISEMIAIQPPKDELLLYSQIMPLIKQVRYKAKYAGEKATDSVLKRLLNTGTYGWLGWQYGMFNSYDEAERITQWGQKIIKQVNEYARQREATVLKTDTDGSLIIVPEKYRGNTDIESEFIKLVESDLNNWLHTKLDFDSKHDIVLEHDGRYKSAIMFDDKSYVLLGHDDKKTIKGNTLTGRSNENFVIQFISDCIDHILDGSPEKIRTEYDYWYDRIQYKMMDVDEVKKRQGLNQSLEEYKNKIAAGQNPIAQYEAALQADRNYIKGDVIETWVEEPEPVIKEYKTRPDKKVIPSKASYEVIRHVKKWNGNIYRDKYHDRLEKAVKKFLVVLGLDTFEELFPELSTLKSDKKKFISIWGLERFNKKFPEFNWTSTYYDELPDEDKTLFQKWVHEGKLSEEYKTIYSNGK